MKRKSTTLHKAADNCMHSLVEAASSILSSTPHTTDKSMEQTRQHLSSALDSGKEIYKDLRKKAAKSLNP
ncbi:MAG: hypothetical protein ABI615_05720 [Chthoniobacterales bacterium]